MPAPRLLGALVVAVLILALGVVGVATHDGPAQRVVADGEWTNFGAVPLTPRAFPLIAWTGREVVIFGGGETPGDRKVVHNLDDGAIYDPAKDAWRPMAEPPFEPPLAGPTGTWTGSELLVVGAPCEDQLIEDAAQWNCSPGGLEAGAFDPVENTWREVPLPASLGDDAHQRSVQALGRTTHGSVFALNGRYWIVSADSTWSELPSPPIRPRLLCVVGDLLLTVDYTDDSAYQDQLHVLEQAQVEIAPASLTPPEQRSAMTVATLDLTARRWKTVPRPGIDGTAPRYLNSTCAPDGVYVYSAGKGGDPSASHAHYDAAAEAWEPIAAPAGQPNVGPPATFVDGRLVVWGDSLMQYDPTTNVWADLGAVEPPTTVVPAGDRALLYSFLNGDSGTVQYRSFKP